MNESEAILAIYRGDMVRCTKDEYHSGLRTAIQTQAGKWIDGKDFVRATIALEEVKRLDQKFENEV